jgi:hypothetical protein
MVTRAVEARLRAESPFTLSGIGSTDPAFTRDRHAEAAAALRLTQRMTWGA